MRILQFEHPEKIRAIFQEIGVDPYGTRIMLPKASSYLVRINALSNITANILKQEMLSFGGDAAVARGALTGKSRKTDCLLMGNLSQFIRLEEKLRQQPFGLNDLAKDLSSTLKNYQKENFILQLGRFKLNLSRRTRIMGIVNLTPDSFSGDGLYKARSSKLEARSYIVEYAEKLVREGADILDLGGESSRPGARPVSLKEELSRVIPILKILAKKSKVPISIDTSKPEVARQALENGASLVNDITGLRNPRMARIAAKYKAGVVIMHMKGNPRIMQKDPRYVSLLDEIIGYLKAAVKRAEGYGIDKEKIIIDPGIGFGKQPQHNLEILSSLEEFKSVGRPILVGPSRKSFIGKLLGALPQERIFGTVASCVLAARNGAKIVRVHDVKAVKQALMVMEACK